MSLCLSRDELRELSGSKQRSKIVAWLVRNGFRPRIGVDGWPRVDRGLYEQTMLGTLRRAEPEPNFAFLKEPK